MEGFGSKWIWKMTKAIKAIARTMDRNNDILIIRGPIAHECVQYVQPKAVSHRSARAHELLSGWHGRVGIVGGARWMGRGVVIHPWPVEHVLVGVGVGGWGFGQLPLMQRAHERVE